MRWAWMTLAEVIFMTSTLPNLTSVSRKLSARSRTSYMFLKMVPRSSSMRASNSSSLLAK